MGTCLVWTFAKCGSHRSLICNGSHILFLSFLHLLFPCNLPLVCKNQKKNCALFSRLTHTHTLNPQSTQRAQMGDYGRTLNLNSRTAGSECWWGDLLLWHIIIQCPTWLKHRRASLHICNCVPQGRRMRENTHSYPHLKHKLKVAMFFFSSLLTTTRPWPCIYINLLLFNLWGKKGDSALDMRYETW